MGKRTIDIELNYKTNMASLQQTMSQLDKIIEFSRSRAKSLETEWGSTSDIAQQMKTILQEAWNPKIGQLDLTKVNKGINETFHGISNVKDLFDQMGEEGTQAFNSITQAILNTNTGLKQSNKFLDEMAKSFFNSAKWAATTAAVNTITGSVQKAWSYSLKLDKSLNEIRIVTGKSADEMDRFAVTANKAAKELSASTLDYTKAALIYYQQGLGEEEVQARANVTLKVANVTGQSGDEVSEQLTAVWNGYKVSADEAELYMDKLSAVAAATASDLEELSIGMAKVASAANTMGVDIDQLNAQIATIVSVTRQAPESVGTALKTIYARMSDIEAGTEEEGVTLGNYTSQMAEMGVKVLDSQGKLRDMGDVIEEVGNKWKTYSREQQVALAQTMAGTRQYNNLVSLFDNWSMYTEALDTSKNSAGELQRQQDIYMESTEAHLQQLATEAEKTYNILFDDSAVKTMTSALTNMLSVLNSLFTGLGGGTSALTAIGLGAVNMFSGQISEELERKKGNRRKEDQARKNYQEQRNWTNLTATEKAAIQEGDPEGIEKALAYYREQIADRRPFLSLEIIEEAEKNLDTLEKSSKKTEELQAITKLVKRFDKDQQDEIYYEALLNRISDEKTYRSETDHITAAIENYKNLSDDLSNIEPDEGTFAYLLDELAIQQQKRNRVLNLSTEIESEEDELAKNNKKLSSYKNPNGAWAKKLQERNELLELNLEDLKEEKDQLEADLAKRSVRQVLQEVEKMWSELKVQLPNVDQEELDEAVERVRVAAVMNDSDSSFGFYPDMSKELLQLVSNKGAEAEKAKEIADNAYKKNASRINKGESAGTILGGEQREVASSINSLEESLNSALSTAKRQDLIKGISTITSSLISMSGVIKTIGNESLSTGEKAMAVLSSSLMTIVQLKSNIDSIKTVIPTLSEGIGVVKNKVVSVSDKSKEEGGAIKLFSKSEKNGKGRTGLQNLGQLTKDLGATAKAAMTTQVAIGSLTVPIWGLVAAAAAVAAAVGVVYYAMTKTKRDAEEAQEQLNAINQATNNVTTSFNQLKASLDEYDTARKGLDKLKEGTDEWQASVDELNGKMLDLIDIYPELASMMSLEGGVYTLSEEGLETYLEKEQQKVNTAKINQLNASNTNTLAQQDLMIEQGTKEVRKSSIDETAGNWAAGLAGLATIGAIIATGGTALPILLAAGLAGAAVGGATGLATYGAFKGTSALRGTEISEVDYAELLQKVVDNPAILENSESLKEAGYANENLREAILDSKATILQQAQELRNNTEQLKIRNQQIAATDLNRSVYYQGLDDEVQKDIIKTIYQSYMDTDEYKQGTEDFERGWDKDLQKAYAEYMGYDTDNIKNHNWFSKAGKATYTYQDEKGNTQTIVASDKTAEDELRKASSRDAVINGEQVREWGDIAEKFLSLAGENEEYKKILAAMAQGKDANFNTLSQDEIQQFMITVGYNLGDNPLNKEEWEAIGFEASGYFMEGLLNGQENWDESAYWKNATEEAKANISTIEDFFESYGKGDTISDDTYQELENKYSELTAIAKRGSYEYLEVLRNAQEQEEDLLFNGAVFKREEAEEAMSETLAKITELTQKLSKEQDADKRAKLEIELKGNFETLDEQIEDYNNANKQIKVQFYADMESDVTQAFDMAGQYEDLQDLLSDDLELTYAEAQEVIKNGNGAILKDAKETANSTIKLNKSVKDQYIKDKEAELEAAKKAKIQQLEDNNELLENQKSILQKELENLESALEAETEEQKLELLAQALLYDKDYQAQVEADKAKLEANDIKNRELSDNEAKFFNSLNSMYRDDLSNVKEYLTNLATSWGTFWSNIGRGIDAAWDNLWKKDEDKKDWGSIWKIFTGGQDPKESGENVASSYIKGVTTELDRVKSKLTDTYESLLDGDEESLDKIIEARKRVIEQQIQDLDNQIGSNDAGIAALKASYLSLENARKNAGTQAYQKELEKEKDLYHDINIEITKLETQLARLQKAQSKLTGQALVDNLNAQTLAIKKQKDALERKLNTDEKYAQYEQKYLKGLLAEQGVLFNEQGEISNYDNIFDTHYAYLKELKKQESTTTNKDAKQVVSNLLTMEEEDFDKMIKYIERYDTLMTQDIPGWEDTLSDLVDKEIEIAMTKFNMEIDLRIDTAQATRDWNSFKKTIINGIKDDDILGNAKARLEDFYTYYNDAETGVIQRNTKHVADILFELREIDDGLFSEYYGDDKAAALEDLKTYYEQLMQDLQGVEEMSEEIRQSYLNMMDEAQQEFDKQIKGYEQIQSLIEHDIKLIQLVYGDKSYDALAKYYEKSEENYNSQIDFARLQVDFWRQQREEAEEGTERWEKARENEEAAIIKLRDLVNTSIENIQDKYLNAIKAIFEELNSKVTSGAGLEYVKEEWDLVKENSEQYLDNINAAYGIQQLQAKYLKAIDETDSISAQKKLNALMEQEIAALEERDKLSEYDVERANKKYEIALKQIALEEAQQNKTSMRLRRDSQGNYSYQFVANEDDISNAEDELAEARNALYNFDKENYLNNLEEMRQAYEDYQKKMFEAAQINDPEERAKKELLINEQYNELITTLTEKNQTIRSNLYESALDELADLYKENAEDYRNMTQTQKDILMNDLIPQWDGGVQHMADTFAGEGGFTEVCKDAMQQLGEATESYDESLKKIEETAELSFNKIYEGEDIVIDETKDLLQMNEELIESYEDQLDAVQAVINKLEELAAAHREAAAAAKEYTTAAYEYQTEDSGKNSDEGQKSRDYSYDMTRAIVDGKANDRSTSSIKTDYDRYRKERNTKINNTEDWSGVSSERLDRLFEAYWAGNSDAEKIVMAVYNKEANFTDELLTRYATKFATGGYTGNDEGLAMLHSKELVLNQTDTKNVLGAVSILRDIVSSVGDAVLQRAASLGSNIAAYYGQKTEKQTLEQNVHIEATFPNVTNSTEIEDALNNLMNKASQRALI